MASYEDEWMDIGYKKAQKKIATNLLPFFILYHHLIVFVSILLFYPTLFLFNAIFISYIFFSTAYTTVALIKQVSKFEAIKTGSSNLSIRIRQINRRNSYGERQRNVPKFCGETQVL